MRWARCSTSDGPRLGVVVGDTIRLSRDRTSLVELLTEGSLDEAGRKALSQPLDVVPMAGASLLSPLERPPSIRDFMVFEQHVEGVGRLAAPVSSASCASSRSLVPDVWYQQPLYYFSNPAALLGPVDDVEIPPGCEVFDFELEVAAVIGTAGGDLTMREADSAIAGYLIMNDWSARDLQFAEMRGPLGPCKGKDSAITLGPFFVTADELAPHRSESSFDLEMRVWVDDELFGADRMDSMAWSFPEMAAYASRGTRLLPGDVLGSGTCGNGCLAELWGRQGREAHLPLQPGNVVRMAVEGLGEIRNRVVPGRPVRQPLTPRPRKVSEHP